MTSFPTPEDPAAIPTSSSAASSARSGDSCDGAAGVQRSRRLFMLAGVGMILGGCASSAGVRRSLPGPAWDVARGPSVPLSPEPAVGIPTVVAGGPVPNSCRKITMIFIML